MPRKIDKKNDMDVLEYLKSHTYVETAEHFKISEMTISRIKKRNNGKVSVSDNVSVSGNKKESTPIADNDLITNQNVSVSNLNKVSVSDNVSVSGNKKESTPIADNNSIKNQKVSVSNLNKVSVSDNVSVSKNSGDPGTNNFLIPEHIIIAWKDLAPSISSAFSKRKWPTKNKMFTIFDNWMNSLLKNIEAKS